MSKTRVYFNSACPVCKAGITHERRELEACGAEVEWVDVHEANESVKELGAELEFVRERLHVMDEAGNVHVGWDAFAELWSRSPRQNVLAKAARAPVVRTMLGWAYNGFAAVLYRWN